MERTISTLCVSEGLGELVASARDREKIPARGIRDGAHNLNPLRQCVSEGPRGSKLARQLDLT